MEELFVCKITVNYKYIYSLCKFYRKTKLRGTFIGISIWIGAIVLICAILGLRVNGQNSSAVIILGIIIMASIGLFYFFILDSIIARYNMKRHYKNILNTQYTFKMYSDMLECISELGKAELMFDSVIEWYECKNYFYIPNKNNVYIIGKNGFEKGTADEFRNYLETKPQFIREKKT